jgi:hypothetical protein
MENVPSFDMLGDDTFHQDFVDFHAICDVRLELLLRNPLQLLNEFTDFFGALDWSGCLALRFFACIAGRWLCVFQLSPA